MGGSADGRMDGWTLSASSEGELVDLGLRSGPLHPIRRSASPAIRLPTVTMPKSL